MKKKVLILWVILFAAGIVRTAIGQESSREIINHMKDSNVSETINPIIKPLSVINPLTGLFADDLALLELPPTILPIARFPESVRPSAGHAQAAWIFELYDRSGDSRLMALYYGSLPQSNVAYPSDATIGALDSAIFGLESLRKQYSANLITTGNPKTVEDSGLHNVQHWYGTDGKTSYPHLPVSQMLSFMEKWKQWNQLVDQNAIAQYFTPALPDLSAENGVGLFVHYAPDNEILWSYDPNSGSYLRQQTYGKSHSLLPDVDMLTNEQVSMQNVIILFSAYELNAELNLSATFNYISKLPALIFRDGRLYNATWTTKNEDYEITHDKLRPIRFMDENGNLFPLKPGQTWVHVVQENNPVYEITNFNPNTIEPGSGLWKLPYISGVRGEERYAFNENVELGAYYK